MPMTDLTPTKEPAAISAVWAATRSAGFSMASDPLTCSLLRTLAASKPGGRLLELGSGTGLSTAWLLDGMNASAHLTTMDHDASLLSIVKEQLGHDQRLTIVCADGDAFLGSLQGQQFDLIFADTWAGKYRLLDEALALVRPGGWYVIDDMLPQPNWPDGHAHKAAQLMAALAQHQDFHITPMDWASGIVLAARR